MILRPNVLAAASLLALVACGTTPLSLLDAGLPTDGGAIAMDGGSPADGGASDGGAQDGGTMSCANDAACGQGRVCENNVCIAACSMQNPCMGGFTVTCDMGRCRQRCLGDGTCPMGQICENFVCLPPQCTTTMPCTGSTPRRCVSGRCEAFTECTNDSNCMPNFTCKSGVCEELPRCIGDGNCMMGQICEDTHCRPAPACAREADCTSTQDCVGGLCVPTVCRGAADCPMDKVCTGGACVSPGNPSFIFKVVILTPGGIIRRGETRPLVALALDQTDRPVEGARFTWATDRVEAVSVDLTTGTIRGNDQAGTAQIRATAQGTTITSEPVSFTNLLAPPDNTLRITLINRVTGLPVTNAKVLIGADVFDVPTGTLSVPAPNGPVDVSAFHPQHDYITVLKTSVRDLVLPLAPRSALDPAAGLTGTIDLTSVSTMGPVRIGLAGLSSSRILSDLSLDALFGDTFTAQVMIPGMGSVGVPLPGGFTVSATLFAGLNIDLKTDFYASGDPGTRAAWSFGGRVDIGEVTSLFMGGGGGGGGGMGNILRQILPLFERFDHGVTPAVQLGALPRIVDTADIDGDMDRAERVPDWRNFRRSTLSPRQRQTLRTEVELSDLPELDGTPVQGAVLTVGALVPGTGFVPLGISGAFDESNMGQVDPVVLKSAPVHSGLGVGRYVVIATAASFGGAMMGGGMGGVALPTTFSARVAGFDTLPTRVELGEFLGFPEGGTYAPTTREYSVPPVPDASITRLVFQGTTGAWEVFAPGTSGTLTGRLPSVPAGVTEDLAAGATARAEAIILTAGASLTDLLAGANAGLQALNAFIAGYSRANLVAP